MFIPNDELIGLVKSTSRRATPADAKQVRLVINTLERSGLTADSSSDSSTRLQRLLSTHRTVLTADAAEHLNGVLAFGIELPLCDAFPKQHGARPCIFVYDGLLYLLRYYTDLQSLIALLVDVDAPRIEVNGEPMSLGSAVSLAGHATFVASIETGHPLTDISALLGPTAMQRAEYGYSAAALFFLLHELGHLVCGHLDTGYVSERVAIETRIPEALNRSQRMELEADAFALECISPQVRNPMISSVMLAMGPFAFLETFSGSVNGSHPLTVNRLAHLPDQVVFPDDPALAAATREIVQSEVNRFERLATQRAQSGGDIHAKIHEHMPLDLAYDVMTQAGRRVKAEFGVLDFDATI